MGLLNVHNMMSLHLLTTRAFLVFTGRPDIVLYEIGSRRDQLSMSVMLYGNNNDYNAVGE